MDAEHGARRGEPSIGPMTSRRTACCVFVALSLVAPAAASGAAKKPTVASELSRLAATGAIAASERDGRLAAYRAVTRTVKRLPRRSKRRAELAGAVRTGEGIAPRRGLTRPRPVPPWVAPGRKPADLAAHPTRARSRHSFP